jgi:hypothetical protein
VNIDFVTQPENAIKSKIKPPSWIKNAKNEIFCCTPKNNKPQTKYIKQW